MNRLYFITADYMDGKLDSFVRAPSMQDAIATWKEYNRHRLRPDIEATAIEVPPQDGPTHSVIEWDTLAHEDFET